MGELSYHDVTVYCGETAYQPSENYALELTCTKAGGWSLWSRWDGKEKLLGGEFEGEPFCVEVNGIAIVGKRPEAAAPPTNADGWDGVHRT